MQGLLYEENQIGVFLLVSVLMGGGAASLAGRAIAATWRPLWSIVIYALILAAVVRFIHYSLFDGTLLTLHYYLIDGLICVGFGLLGFRATRVTQMVTHYRWINERAGPLRWRRKAV